MRRWLTLVSVAVVVAAACGRRPEPAPPLTTTRPSASTTVSTTPASSVVPPTTSTTLEPPAATTSTTAVPVQSDIAPPLLVAGPDGILVLAANGQEEVVLEGRAVSLAVPDLSGGVVFQGPVPQPTNLVWDPDRGRNAFAWDHGGPEPIWHIAAPGEQPVAIVKHSDARLQLVDVVEIDGRPQVLYRMMIGGPAGEAAWHQVFEWLGLYDLVTRETRLLGLIGSYESSSTDLRFGGDLVAVGHVPYGDDPGAHVGFVELSHLGEAADYGWLPRLVSEHVPYGPAVRCAVEGCYGWATVTAASDGSRIAWVEGDVRHPPGGMRFGPVTVVVMDRATGEEELRVTVAATGTEAGAHFIDDDGSWIVVSGVGANREVVVVTPDGSVLDLGLAGETASWWENEVTTTTEQLERVTPLVLRVDGLDIVAFGDPTAEVLERLEVAMSPWSRATSAMYHAVHWDDVSLTLLFHTNSPHRSDGVEHFVGWAHWDQVVSPLRTAEGIGIGDTFHALIEAHGDRVEIPETEVECLPSWSVWIGDPASDGSRRMLAELDGPPDDPDSRIVSLAAGASLGC